MRTREAQHAADQALLDEFVAAFAFNAEVDAYDEHGQPLPPPVACATDAHELEPLYALLPGRFPPLYEQLILSYRWPPVELPYFVLLPNPPGRTLDGLLAQMRRDNGLWTTLLPNGCVPFGKAGGGHYDPICFDIRHRQKDGDCPLVRVEHEAILCFDRIGETFIVATSFRDLVETFVRQTLDTLGVESTIKT